MVDNAGVVGGGVRLKSRVVVDLQEDLTCLGRAIDSLVTSTTTTTSPTYSLFFLTNLRPTNQAIEGRYAFCCCCCCKEFRFKIDNKNFELKTIIKKKEKGKKYNNNNNNNKRIRVLSIFIYLSIRF